MELLYLNKLLFEFVIWNNLIAHEIIYRLIDLSIYLSLSIYYIYINCIYCIYVNINSSSIYVNSSSIETFNSVNMEYRNALENSGKLNYTQTREYNSKYKKVEISLGLTRHIAKTSLPMSQNVSCTYWTIISQNLTNCARYSTDIISTHNKKLIKEDAPNTKACNYRTKSTCP